MHKYLIRSLFSAAISLPAFVVCANTTPDNLADRWNLNDLYATNAAFDQDIAKLQTQLKELSNCNRQLGDSVQRFKICMDLNADALKRFARISSYASQTFDQDTGSSAGMDLSQRANILGSQFEEASASCVRKFSRSVKRRSIAF